MYANQVQNEVVPHLAENKSHRLSIVHIPAVLLYPLTCSNSYCVTNFTDVMLLYTYFCTPLYNLLLITEVAALNTITTYTNLLSLLHSLSISFRFLHCCS